MAKRRTVSLLFVCILLLPLTTSAQLIQEFRPLEPTACCLQFLAQRLADQLQDWNQLGRYYDENRRLQAQPVQKGRVVFLGDSITEIWNLAKCFPGKPYVNRGIGGQTTPQMLVRMYPDVINLSPEAVVILAGTNDIGRLTGPATLEMIADNFRAMSRLAETHGVKVILCLLTPVSDYAKHQQTKARPPSDILKLNDWLRSYIAETHAEIADYHSVLVDDRGMLKEIYSDDGVHPNERGYELMAPIAEAAITRALK